MPTPLYRLGHGPRVDHIVQAAGRDEVVKPLCETRMLFYAKEIFPAANRVRPTCKRCQALWAKATGSPAPAKPRFPGVVTRDVQRQRAYDAEGEVGLVGRALKTEAEAQAYVDGVLADPWAVARWGHMRVRVKFTHGVGAYSHNWRRMITLGTCSRTQMVALHETAHQIVDRAYGPKKVQAHGPLFLRVLHALVQHKLGVAAGRALLAGATKHKAKVASPALVLPRGERPALWRDQIHTGRVPA